METSKREEKNEIEKYGDGIVWLGKAIWSNPLGKVVVVAGGGLVLMGVVGVGARVLAYMMGGLNEVHREWHK